MNFCWFLGWKEGGGGKTVRDGSVRGQGAQEPINPPSLGGWKFFLRGWEEITRNLKETEGTSVVVANRV